MPDLGYFAVSLFGTTQGVFTESSDVNTIWDFGLFRVREGPDHTPEIS